MIAITLFNVLVVKLRLLAKGSIEMVDMYYRLVKAGLRTIQKVPDQFKDAVMANISALDGKDNATLTPIVSNVTVNEMYPHA
jgi:hypothetical protein